MRSIAFVSLLAISLASPAIAQNDSASLGDVARQSRHHTASAKKVWNEETTDIGQGPEDTSSPCGTPVTTVPIGSTSALVGKDVPAGDAVGKSLLKWREKHSGLDSISTDDLAKLSFPRTPDQARANAAMAAREVAGWISELQAAKESGPERINSLVTDIMNTHNSAGPASVVAMAVEKETQRRARSDGSPADKMAEAVNLYAICENQRMTETLDDVDARAKADLRKRIAEAVKESQQQGGGLQ
jgi:hypothetical protein